MCNDKGGMPPPRHAFSTSVTHYAGVRIMGVVDGDRSLGGGGLIAVPPPPSSDLSSPAQKRGQHWLGPRARPPRRARPRLSPCSDLGTFLEILAIKPKGLR
jgi:hypothetical protein